MNCTVCGLREDSRLDRSQVRSLVVFCLSMLMATVMVLGGMRTLADGDDVIGDGAYAPALSVGR